MKTKVYTVTKKCCSFDQSEIIRSQIHDEINHKMIDRNIPFAKITTQALYDSLVNECIVKITITY